MTQIYKDELAQLYDAAVPDWPGEIAFYQQLIQQAPSAHPSVLEIACGTGRVTVQLAGPDVSLVGIDLSDEMLVFAQSKTTETSPIRWLQADMRSFELSRTFDLALVPAYSFQLLLTEADQTACLRQIARHLKPGTQLALHLEQHDTDWLASLPSHEFTPFEASGETSHPSTGQRIRVSYAWSYIADTRSVAVTIRYEIIEESGAIASCIDRGPLHMYCTSRHQLQEQLAEAGFKTEGVYSNFFETPYKEDGEELIWVARKD